MAANEELVEAVAQAIHGAEVGWRSALGTNTPKRIMVARAVLAVPAIADALAGCHAVTSDEGTSYCPLAEANAAAVARDAKVAEIVAEWLGSDNAPWPMTRALEHTIAIAALYGATRDHIAALRAVDDSDIVPGSEFDGPVIL